MSETTPSSRTDASPVVLADGTTASVGLVVIATDANDHVVCGAIVRLCGRANSMQLAGSPILIAAADAAPAQQIYDAAMTASSLQSRLALANQEIADLKELVAHLQGQLSVMSPQAVPHFPTVVSPANETVTEQAQTVSPGENTSSPAPNAS